MDIRAQLNYYEHEIYLVRQGIFLLETETTGSYQYKDIFLPLPIYAFSL